MANFPVIPFGELPTAKHGRWGQLGLRLLVSLLIIGLTHSSIPPLAIAENTAAKGISKITNSVLRITDQGLTASTLALAQPGSSVFVFNDTSNQELNIELEFGEKPGFCATGAMKMGSDGIFRSRKPLLPGHFLVVCFAHAGSYPYKVTTRSEQKVSPATAKSDIIRTGLILVGAVKSDQEQPPKSSQQQPSREEPTNPGIGQS